LKRVFIGNEINHARVCNGEKTKKKERKKKENQREAKRGKLQGERNKGVTDYAILGTTTKAKKPGGKKIARKEGGRSG